MFSSRTPSTLTPNRLSQAVAARRRAGRPIVDLTVTNPTRAGFDYPSALLAPLADVRGLTYDPQPFGLPEARQAIADDYARRGLTVDADRLVLTSSTSEAYSLLFKLLADPGDEVLVPRPSYPLFDHLTRLDCVAPRPYDLEYHGAWSIDLDSLRRGIGAPTRAVLLVSPNNPTGSFVTSAELDAVARLAAARGLAVVADEVFADYTIAPGARAAAGRPLDRRDALVFSLGGLSKSAGLPQLKLGWIAVAGPDALVRAALERLEIICDTYLSVSTPVQAAVPALIEAGRGVGARILARVARNHRRLHEIAAAAPACRALVSEGGWSGVLQVPTLRPEEDLVLDLLESDGLLVHPGYFFDFARESFLVVSLLTPEDVFDRALTTIVGRWAGVTEAP